MKHMMTCFEKLVQNDYMLQGENSYIASILKQLVDKKDDINEITVDDINSILNTEKVRNELTYNMKSIEHDRELAAAYKRAEEGKEEEEGRLAIAKAKETAAKTLLYQNAIGALKKYELTKHDQEPLGIDLYDNPDTTLDKQLKMTDLLTDNASVLEDEMNDLIEVDSEISKHEIATKAAIESGDSELPYLLQIQDTRQQTSWATDTNYDSYVDIAKNQMPELKNAEHILNSMEDDIDIRFNKKMQYEDYYDNINESEHDLMDQNTSQRRKKLTGTAIKQTDDYNKDAYINDHTKLVDEQPFGDPLQHYDVNIDHDEEAQAILTGLQPLGYKEDDFNFEYATDDYDSSNPPHITQLKEFEPDQQYTKEQTAIMNEILDPDDDNESNIDLQLKKEKLSQLLQSKEKMELLKQQILKLKDTSSSYITDDLINNFLFDLDYIKSIQQREQQEEQDGVVDDQTEEFNKFVDDHLALYDQATKVDHHQQAQAQQQSINHHDDDDKIDEFLYDKTANEMKETFNQSIQNDNDREDYLASIAADTGRYWRGYNDTQDHDELPKNLNAIQDDNFIFRDEDEVNFLTQMDPNNIDIKPQHIERLEKMDAANDDIQLSDKVKKLMWSMHKKDPAKYHPRTLSEIFQISIDRAHAILLLQAMEQRHIDMGFPIITEFDDEENMPVELSNHIWDPEHMLPPQNLTDSYNTPEFSFADDIEILNIQKRDANKNKAIKTHHDKMSDIESDYYKRTGYIGQLKKRY